MTEYTGGFIPKKEAVEIVETPIDKQQSRALGGLLEATLRAPLEATRTAITGMGNNEQVAEFISNLLRGCDKIDRVVTGFRNADQVGLDNHYNDPDFMYHEIEDQQESPALQIGETILQGDDYRKIIGTLSHQINAGLSSLQYAHFTSRAYPEASALIEANRQTMLEMMGKIQNDEQGIKITVHPDLHITMDPITPPRVIQSETIPEDH